MLPAVGLLLSLAVSLLLVATSEAGRFDFELSDHGGGNSRPSGFDFSQRQPSLVELPPSFFSEVQSSKSDNKQSRTEETLNEVLTQSQSSSWAHGFQDNGQGGLKKLDSSSSESRTAGRSAKELKASESGESVQRDKQLKQVNGKTVLNTDTGKQSSFNNGGHIVNRTEFSSSSSSSDNRLARVVLPSPPKWLTACFGEKRTNLIFLVHAGSDADAFVKVLGFLEAFLGRLAPAQAVVVFFNSRVLDVLDFPVEALEGGGGNGAEDGGGGVGEALRRRLAVTARGLRGALDDDCNLSVATAEAERLRRQLRIRAPCSLVLLALGSLRADERDLADARVACDEARRSFDQLMTVVDRESVQHEPDPQAASLLDLFSGGPRGFVPLKFGGGGDLVDAKSVDALGQRVCDVAEPNDRRSDFEEPGPLPCHQCPRP